MIDKLIQDFVDNAEIADNWSSDKFFIFSEAGNLFLYDNGIISKGCTLYSGLGEPSPFWPTKAAAETFFKEWKFKMEKSIYLVWSPQTIITGVEYDTFTEARFESRRLAEQTPGNDYFVLRAVESVCYKPSPFVTIMYSQEERK